MTCIVGIADGKAVYMGGDSVSAAGSQMTIRKDRKVFRNGEFIIGFTSSFRMGQLLQYSLHPPRRHPDVDVFRFMATTFIDEIRNLLKAGGYAEKHAEQEKAGVFLVGYAGRLFKIDCDYQVAESADGYDACGAGEDIALGSLFSTAPFMKPVDRIMIALSAAANHSAYVRPPFHTEILKGAPA